jgi:hypothetical protein
VHKWTGEDRKIIVDQLPDLMGLKAINITEVKRLFKTFCCANFHMLMTCRFVGQIRVLLEMAVVPICASIGQGNLFAPVPSVTN